MAVGEFHVLYSLISHSDCGWVSFVCYWSISLGNELWKLLQQRLFKGGKVVVAVVMKWEMLTAKHSNFITATEPPCQMPLLNIVQPLSSAFFFNTLFSDSRSALHWQEVIAVTVHISNILRVKRNWVMLQHQRASVSPLVWLSEQNSGFVFHPSSWHLIKTLNFPSLSFSHVWQPERMMFTFSTLHFISLLGIRSSS